MEKKSLSSVFILTSLRASTRLQTEFSDTIPRWRLRRGTLELRQLHLPEPPRAESLRAVRDAPVHLSPGRSAPRWQCSWAPVRRKGNRGNLRLSSLSISDYIGGGEWRRSRLCSLQQNAGGFFSPFLNSLQRHRKGYLKLGKDSLLKECTQRSQELFCGIPFIQVTAEWPLFYKLELWITVWHVTVSADKLWIPRADFPGHSSLENQGSRAFSCCFLLKGRTGKSTQNTIGGGGGWQNNKSICNCCFFQR